jgi:ubiquinol-cytochrome c reductase cytochrome c1 subunit
MKQLVKILSLLWLLQSVFAQTPEIERGRDYFFNYCAGCHSLQYVASDLLTDIYPAPWPWRQHLTKGKWQSPLLAQDAQAWFGKAPPDLSLITLQHPSGWVQNYLLSFYHDPLHDLGRNNYLLPNLRMPDVLYAQPQRLEIAQDIVAFLSFAAQPEKKLRWFIGFITFTICIFALILAILLKKAYKV